MPGRGLLSCQVGPKTSLNLSAYTPAANLSILVLQVNRIIYRATYSHFPIQYCALTIFSSENWRCTWLVWIIARDNDGRSWNNDSIPPGKDAMSIILPSLMYWTQLIRTYTCSSLDFSDIPSTTHHDNSFHTSPLTTKLYVISCWTWLFYVPKRGGRDW